MAAPLVQGGGEWDLLRTASSRQAVICNLITNYYNIKSNSCRIKLLKLLIRIPSFSNFSPRFTSKKLRTILQIFCIRKFRPCSRLAPPIASGKEIHLSLHNLFTFPSPSSHQYFQVNTLKQSSLTWLHLWRFIQLFIDQLLRKRRAREAQTMVMFTDE